MRILRDRSCLLVIDFQERIFPFIHENEKLLKNVSVLIKGLKVLELPVFVTEQYTKGLGVTVQALADVLDGIHRIEKSTFSCCDEPRFNMELATSGKENVIIAGIEAHVCVLQTVIDLARQGYQAVVVEDCISSRKPNDKVWAIERMRKEGAIITTYESILFELLRNSGGETFKAISKLVK
ncbi:MAG: hydrolase [Bacteroidetes bacterium]|nr:hydrolase [Bacteroidota bacterium]